jgi:hypothetical protein
MAKGRGDLGHATDWSLFSPISAQSEMFDFPWGKTPTGR